MTPLEIKLGVSVLGMILKWCGEVFSHNCQRFILPIVYAIGVSLLSHTWWLGFLVIPMIGGLVIGYKDYGKTDSVARALWLFVITVLSGIGPTLTHHESWIAFIAICFVSGWVGTLVRNINNLIGAPLNGLVIVSHIFFIH